VSFAIIREDIMTEFDFTKATQILTLATGALFISWITIFFYYPESPGIIFTLIPTFFAAIATYAAATDMDMPVFHTRYLQLSRYLGETSAASTLSLMAFGFVVLDVIIWIIVKSQSRFNLMDTIALILTIIGGGFVSLGGILAHKEWNM
jgi:hypothetical protein